MKVLVDTHVALWALAGDPRLSKAARDLLERGEHDRYLSLASAVEVAVKVSVGKLSLGRPTERLFAAFATDLQLVPLPITHAHCAALARLPLHHRDPFDRLLVAQAQVESLTLVSADPALAPYGVPMLW